MAFRRTQKYDDEHRIFLQSLMSHGIMNTMEVKKLFRKACKHCTVQVPTNVKEEEEMLRNFIVCINDKIEDLNLTIKKAIDEESRNKNAYFVLCNKADRSGDSSKLTKKAMLDFTPAELEYLLVLLDTIVSAEERQITQTEALIRSSDVKKKKISQKQAELIVSKLVAFKWLRLSSDKSFIRLSTRFLAEMEPYLRENYRDVINSCNLCSKMVVRSLKCDSCNKEFHLHCLVATSGGRRDSSVCNNCKEQIFFYEVQEEKDNDDDDASDIDREEEEDSTDSEPVVRPVKKLLGPKSKTLRN